MGKIMTDAPTTVSYAIRVVTHAEWNGERDRLKAERRSMWDEVKSSGTVPLKFFHDDQRDTDRFCIICPGCGGNIGGILSDVPVGGWDEPRWAIQNEAPEHLTMTPSLGCGGWRVGSCIGHWWIRDGGLVLV